MSRGEFLTRVTIWFALGGYFLGAMTYLISGKDQAFERLARLAWTVGCVSLIIHVAFAFHYYHAWSHAAAYRETARQTADVVGFNWGGGIFINYILVAAWMADVIWWWMSPDTRGRRSKVLTAGWQGFLIFIIFNATVIFKTGPLRWIGLSLCLTLLLLWFLRNELRKTFFRIFSKSKNQFAGSSRRSP